MAEMLSPTVPERPDACDFLRLPDVLKRTGLSKSEVYRKAGDPSDPFPQRRQYRDRRGSFWTSLELTAWQLAELDVNDFDELLR